MSDDELIVEKADVDCPSCGAPLEFEVGDRMAECEYCGTHVRLRRIKESVDEKDPNWAEHRRNRQKWAERNEPEVVGNCSVCGKDLTDSWVSKGYKCDDCDAWLCDNCRVETSEMSYPYFCPTCYEKNGHAHIAKMSKVKNVVATGLAFGLLGSVIFAMWKAGGSQ